LSISSTQHEGRPRENRLRGGFLVDKLAPMIARKRSMGCPRPLVHPTPRPDTLARRVNVGRLEA